MLHEHVKGKGPGAGGDGFGPAERAAFLSSSPFLEGMAPETLAEL